ncbi:hypothetical protein DTO280E4_6709 [Paecilomyces variotii]|nr:hypothetical protein DTO280E4_6709 [Paecilomyces variotii]
MDIVMSPFQTMFDSRDSLQSRIPSSRPLHHRSISLPPHYIQHPFLDLPQPIALIPHQINPILATRQILRSIGLLSPSGRTVLRQRIRSERRSICSFLHIDTDIAEHMRGIHMSDTVEDLSPDVGESLDGSYLIASAYLKGDVFVSKSGIEQRNIAAVDADHGTVDSVRNSFARGERGEDLGVFSSHIDL